MSEGRIDQLIINSPFQEPSNHWLYAPESKTFNKVEGRRPAGYVIASERSRSFDDPGTFVEIPLVNMIRPRVKAWREHGYPGVTGVTKHLLEHWNNPEEREYRFFFCQLEAIETLIWLVESPSAERVGIEIPSDGGSFSRLCAKMATGTGKTVVMTMLLAWQILNKVTYPQDPRFSKNILIIAPGLTVKSRLSVLQPTDPQNYYEAFSMVPPAMVERLRKGKVLIHNWHTLNWESEERLAKRKSVDKRGAKSDEAYVRDVLDSMANVKNLVVINDEAHHAWRVPAESKVKGVKKEDIEEATKWVGGLDRIHRARGILNCFDFSATPFAPSGKQSYEEALFGWIVSDFGLNDAIESGLVKTPRIVVRDDALPDAKSYRSRLYHIYNDPEVKDDLNRPAEPDDPLPDLLRNAYYLLGYDWKETYKKWKEQGHNVPPVMITVANRTETAARIKKTFDKKGILIDELCDPDKTLHIDSKVLDMAEASEEPITNLNEEGEVEAKPKLTKKQEAELLREQVDTVGQEGKRGGQIRNVISVGMLSEGWDAKTVTHIMGLRAFSSQLLCEQVVGRGLRRTAYDLNPETGLFEAEYVNIFGVPFTFLPHEGGEGTPPPPPNPRTRIEALAERQNLEISWPNIARIDYGFRPVLEIDWDKVPPLELKAGETALIAELAPTLGGKHDLEKISTIDLQKLARDQRQQTIIFQAARDVFSQLKPNWKGNPDYLIGQVIRLVAAFLDSGKIKVTPASFEEDDLKRRLVFTLNMNKVIQHIWGAIKETNQETITPIFDPNKPIRSTADMAVWYTSKPCHPARKSQVNFCVYDSTWEASDTFQLDREDLPVETWVKNDHLGFEILYIYEGVVRKYRPDFLVKFPGNNFLIIETKGQDSPQVRAKKKAAEEWVKAVNEYGGFGEWSYKISWEPKALESLLKG